MKTTAGAKDATGGSRRERTTEAIAVSALERRQSSRLVLVFVLVSFFFVVELVGAKIARSDVLEADAFHLLMDVLALAISVGALRLASRRPSVRFTFGLRRAEPMAALANGAIVLGVAVELVRDSIEHLANPVAPRSELVLGVASAALVVNGLNAWLLHGAMRPHDHHHHHHHHHHASAGDDEDHALEDHEHAGDGERGEDGEHEGARHRAGALSVRGAWLHLLGDALGSLAAFTAGVAIRLGAPPIADPIASFVVVAILVVGALRLLRDASLVLLEAAPAHLPVAKVEKALLSVPGVTRVSAVHVWSLGTGHDAVTAHVRASASDPTLAKRVSEQLRKKLDVEYVTIQVEVN
jgi:cation diffusion facilitator family transporter